MSSRLLLTAAVACLLVLLSGPGHARAQGSETYDDWNAELIGFPSNTPDRPRANCIDGGEGCIDRTLGEMWRRFHSVIPTCEHNNIFSLTYIRVTEDIRTAIRDEGFYPDLQWINQQDAMFARQYFLTYSNWAEGRRDLVPISWRIAFDAGRDKQVQGLGNLLLSMNAHINRDFPFTLYHAGLANPDGSSKKGEHDAYNERLRALYKPMLTELALRFDETIDDYDIPGVFADDDAFFSVLRGWRETTWQNAVRLAGAEDDAERRQVAASIEQYANQQANLILAGSSYGPGQDASARDSRCALFGGQRPGWTRGADIARPVIDGPLKGGRKFLRAPVACPEGVGPCAGNVKLRTRTTRAQGKARFALLGKRGFDLRPGERASLRIPIDKRKARGKVRSGRRGVWVVVRSQQELGLAKSRRAKARVA